MHTGPKGMALDPRLPCFVSLSVRLITQGQQREASCISQEGHSCMVHLRLGMLLVSLQKGYHKRLHFQPLRHNHLSHTLPCPLKCLKLEASHFLQSTTYPKSQAVPSCPLSHALSGQDREQALTLSHCQAHLMRHRLLTAWVLPLSHRCWHPEL